MGPWELQSSVSGYGTLWVELDETGRCSCSSRIGTGRRWSATRQTGDVWRVRFVILDKVRGRVHKDDEPCRKKKHPDPRTDDRIYARAVAAIAPTPMGGPRAARRRARPRPQRRGARAAQAWCERCRDQNRRGHGRVRRLPSIATLVHVALCQILRSLSSQSLTSQKRSYTHLKLQIMHPAACGPSAGARTHTRRRAAARSEQKRAMLRPRHARRGRCAFATSRPR